jgi:hypothetical protein
MEYKLENIKYTNREYGMFDSDLFKDGVKVAEVYYPNIDSEISISFCDNVDEKNEIEDILEYYKINNLKTDEEYQEIGYYLIEKLLKS